MCGWVDGLVVGTGSLVIPPDDNSEALDSHLKFTESGDGSWFTAWDYYYDGDALYIADVSVGEEGRLQAIVESDSSETIKFHWKISGESGSDYLKFYIDGSLQDSITGEQDWQQKSYTVSSGIHTLKWVYSEGGSAGDNAWVDFVQWSGASPAQDPSNWQAIDYKHDVYGRRSEKKVDGYGTRYLYACGEPAESNGPHVIAEYDGNNNLLCKYIYGPGIDQPVCMIEVADSNAVYYYHYDGLGSVVALSDSSGDTVQTYEYSVFGQVAAEYEDFPNPYMFAGRRYDIETGLYYNRARYYNPYTGRFMQTDPVRYDDGMNVYLYGRNNPLIFVDPSGKTSNLVGELAIYGGYWANQLPRPSYPGFWTSWVDFFGWYAHGGGETIDLLRIGLLDDLQGNEKITDWLDKYRSVYNKKAFNLAKNLLKQGELFAIKTYTDEIRIDFGGGMNDVLYQVVKGLIDPPDSNPLVVLGNCTIKVNITISAWLHPSGALATWYCQIKFSLRDWFKDPGDIMDSYPGEIEWMDCTPYKIIADFSIVDIGTVLYWDPPSSQAEEE